MYRWFQHRAGLKHPLFGVDNDISASSDSVPQRSSVTDHRWLIFKHGAFLTKRAVLFLVLVLFVVSSVASWQLPVAERQEREVAAIGSVPRSTASGLGPAKSSARHGFTLRTHAKDTAPIKSSLLHAESESEVRTLIAILNESIDLPTEVEFAFEDCKEADVYYDEERHRVVICRQWVNEMERVLSRSLSDKAVLRQTVHSVASAVFLHESAHALIDVLDLPVTGREEDAADQFSTLVLLRQKDGARKVLQVAYTFKVLSRDTERYPPVYWGEHSLNIQRYYDTLCLVYGRDPKHNATSVSGDPLPQERAEICESEYQRIESAWMRLLKPHVRNSLWQAQ